MKYQKRSLIFAAVLILMISGCTSKTENPSAQYPLPSDASQEMTLPRETNSTAVESEPAAVQPDETETAETRPIETRPEQTHAITPPEQYRAIEFARPVIDVDIPQNNKYTQICQKGNITLKKTEGEFYVNEKKVDSDCDWSLTSEAGFYDAYNVFDWSLAPEAGFYDMNQDGKEDIILKCQSHGARGGLLCRFILSDGDGYKDYGGLPDYYSALKIKASLKDDYKMQVICDDYQVNMDVELNDSYKFKQIAQNIYNEDGKLTSDTSLNDFNHFVKLVDAGFYEVDNRFVLYERCHLLEGRYSTGIAIIFRLEMKDGKFILTDVEFAQENYNAY